MSDKFNPNESDFGPGEKSEFSVMIPVSEIVELLTRANKTHEENLKKCPYCNHSVIYYKDDWYFCSQHNFVKLGDDDGRIA